METSTVILIFLGILILICFFLDIVACSAVSSVGNNIDSLNDDVVAATADTATLNTDITNLENKTVNMVPATTSNSGFTGNLNVTSGNLYIQGVNILSELNSINQDIQNGIELTGLNVAYLNVTGSATFNGISNTGTITSSGPITCQSVTCDTAIITQGIQIQFSTAGYIIATKSGSPDNIYPVITSMTELYPGRKENYILVNPGYKMIIYDQGGYAGKAYPYDNTNGITPLGFEAIKAEQGKSLKLFYRGAEINYISQFS